jgi:hypothetical protein
MPFEQELEIGTPWEGRQRAVNLDFQSSNRTAQDEFFFSVSVFEEAGGEAVEAKRGSAFKLLMGEPGKSVILLRTLAEMFMSSRYAAQLPAAMGC